MPSTIDELSPQTGDHAVQAKRLKLSLADPLATRRAFNAILIDVDYTDTDPDGATLPLVLQIVGPAPSSFRRNIYRFTRPAQLAFTPEEGGRFVVKLYEQWGNKSWGTLRFDVEGTTNEATS